MITDEMSNEKYDHYWEYQCGVNREDCSKSDVKDVWDTAIKFAQDKILEMASEGFEAFIEKFVRTDCYSERHMRKAYEAATIASEKKHLKENCDTGIEWIRLDNKIADLQKERAEMKEALIDFDKHVKDTSRAFSILQHSDDPDVKHAKLIEKLNGE